MYCSGVNSRPTIRVVSRLYSKKTKHYPIANEKTLTSCSNRSNEFLRPGGLSLDLMIQNGGLVGRNAAKIEHSECPFRSVRISEIQCMWLT